MYSLRTAFLLLEFLRESTVSDYVIEDFSYGDADFHLVGKLEIRSGDGFPLIPLRRSSGPRGYRDLLDSLRTDLHAESFGKLPVGIAAEFRDTVKSGH